MESLHCLEDISTHWFIIMGAAVKQTVSPRRPWIHCTVHCSWVRVTLVWRPNTVSVAYVLQRPTHMAACGHGDVCPIIDEISHFINNYNYGSPCVNAWSEQLVSFLEKKRIMSWGGTAKNIVGYTSNVTGGRIITGIYCWEKKITVDYSLKSLALNCLYRPFLSTSAAKLSRN